MEEHDISLRIQCSCCFQISDGSILSLTTKYFDKKYFVKALLFSISNTLAFYWVNSLRDLRSSFRAGIKPGYHSDRNERRGTHRREKKTSDIRFENTRKQICQTNGSISTMSIYKDVFFLLNFIEIVIAVDVSCDQFP